MDTATPACIPCGSPTALEVRAPSSPSSPQAAQALLPPPRATLILPDAMAVEPPSPGTSGPLDQQDDVSRGAEALAGSFSTQTPDASLGNDDQRIGTRSDVSSPRIEIGRHGGAALSLKRQPELATSRFSRPGTRTPRVLKTSGDFRETIRRVYKVGANIVLAHIRPLCCVEVYSAQPCQNCFPGEYQTCSCFCLPVAANYSRNIPGVPERLSWARKRRGLSTASSTRTATVLSAQRIFLGEPQP